MNENGEKRENIKVDWIVVESMQVRFDSINKRLWGALIVAIALLFASNCLWLYAWMQYDYTGTSTSTITVDGKDGTANYIGNDGEIRNGEGYDQKNQNENTNTEEQ